MSLTARMPTRHEREMLMGNLTPHYTGFTPRPIEQLSRRKKPTSSLDIELQHRLRIDMDECTHRNPSIQYRLWLEAGKHSPPFPEKPDPCYNSNVWRNFRRQFGFTTSAVGQKIPNVIAAMYPLNIPKPSKVGNETFVKYIQESKLFENEKFKKLAVQRTRTDLAEFRRLKIQSEARNPPIDQDGRILPPENFKKYADRFVIPPLVTSPSPSPRLQDLTDNSLEHRSSSISKPPLWKLTFALNHPRYDELRKEIEKRQMKVQRSDSHTRVIPTPNSSHGD
ncbi:testis-expressed protein 52-like [Gigantopelta aegis]|uniref:testis-expressed protein 52-like n=1 Tax=Gigantopelta aegis TaxID=1735272 RepID=UPI001B88DDA3|nr:testis-expressed protein 52-like [Gigantopelta aegis]XP_041365365.1 testis-expressed protein 52-like [Gigantopelta aegis]